MSWGPALPTATPAGMRANLDSHDLVSGPWSTWCDRCGAKAGGPRLLWPCGQTPPEVAIGDTAAYFGSLADAYRAAEEAQS